MNNFYSKFDFQSHLIFDSLSAQEKDLIKVEMEILNIKKGNAIFYEDGVPTGIFQIISGSAKKYKKGFSNQDQIFYIYTDGDVLGHHALLGEERYQDSCETLDDCIIGFISEINFLRLLQEIPSLKDAVIKNISHEFGVLANIIAVLAQKNQNTRLSIFLLILEHRFKKNNPNYIGINLCREDLANIIGATKESLSRSLKQFKHNEMITIEKRFIHIKNRELLCEFLNLDYQLISKLNI
jgi:CRP-like cAMP-binding protein